MGDSMDLLRRKKSRTGKNISSWMVPAHQSKHGNPSLTLTPNGSMQDAQRGRDMPKGKGWIVHHSSVGSP
jgi:hypothetical protein